MISEEDINLIVTQFQDNYGSVVAIVSRYAPRDNSIDDILQEIFIDFFTGFVEKKWHLIPRETNLSWRPLLLHIAKRRAQLFARKSLQQNRFIDRVAERLRDVSGLAVEKDFDFWDESDLQMDAMKECLDKLPSKSRTLIDQYYFEHASVEKIAKQQMTTPPTIRNFFYRIRIILRQCIEFSLKKEDR